ncbi:methyltransferase domain-containing protein [Candidatus Berkelbacteria bacterium]|nr:methyltransferase domain-containing protein [Candidatus Berkelbacteria bacterium]
MESITEKQRETWNKFSSGWQKWDEFVLAWLKPIGDELLIKAELKNTDKVLDVSTGTGEPGLTAATKVAQVIATDVAEDMVEIARQNALNRKLTNYEVKVADAEHLPFADNSFDAVVCRLGVMYFGNPQAGVNEMVRVLKPSRKLSLAAWAEPTKNPWATTASSVINKLLNLPPPPSDAPGVFRHNNPGMLVTMMEATGLVDTEQNEVTGEMSFNSPEQYWEFVTDVVAPVATPLSTADTATREQAKQAVLNATSDYSKGGKIVFNWSCWVATGSKK